MKDGLIHLNLDAADISYEDFSGAHARADVVFQDDEIRRVGAVTRDEMVSHEGRLELAPEEEIDPYEQDRRHTRNVPRVAADRR